VDDVATVPEGRYGRPPTPARRRRAQLALIGLIVAAVAVIAWVGSGVLRDPVQWSPVGYDVKGPDRTDVTFDVTKAPGSTVRCTVVALSSGFTEVGVKTVTIGPAAQRSQRYTVSLATQELAVTGQVSTCEVVSSGS
jgi:uncharacterized protein DUF4307